MWAFKYRPLHPSIQVSLLHLPSLHLPTSISLPASPSLYLTPSTSHLPSPPTSLQFEIRQTSFFFFVFPFGGRDRETASLLTHKCVVQRTILRRQFSPCTMWVLWIRLRWSALLSRTFLTKHCSCPQCYCLLRLWAWIFANINSASVEKFLKKKKKSICENGMATLFMKTQSS